MPQNIVGTGGPDNLTLTDTSAGVHTVRGGGGDDTIFADANFIENAVAQIFGEDGQDSIRVFHYNGTISGGSGADRIFYGGVGSPGAALFGNIGSDTIEADAEALFIVGGDGSSDGNDCLIGSHGRDLIYGNGGSDTIEGHFGQNILIGGFDNDSIHSDPGTDDFVFGNEGNDTIATSLGDGPDTVFAGQGNDSVLGGGGLFFLNEGNDTLVFVPEQSVGAMTVQGGNDSADGSDSIVGGRFADVILGNGGADSIFGGNGNNVLVGGFGADCVAGGNDADFLFGNQDNDTIHMGNGEGADTVFAGQGNDSILATSGLGRATILGNEGNDSFFAVGGADTIAGGAGSDLFRYSNPNDDGDGAAGGPIELLTDVNFAEDRFQFSAVNIGFAANAGTGNATTLAQAAANAIDTVSRQSTVSGSVAAVFNWTGRTYLAVDTFGNGIFQDSADFLIDITGAAGTVSASNFIPG